MQMEEVNNLIFMVDMKANRKQVEEAVEDRFGEEVEKVNTSITPKGEKKAYIKFKKEGAALDIATKLGIM